MPAKEFKKVCKCENCGNEAEMMITCSLEEEDLQVRDADHTASPAAKPQAKGHGVCTHCGNEAEMWVDLDS